jgi:hypothetical protein
MLETSALYLEDRTKTTQSWHSINYIQPIMQPITVRLGFCGGPKKRGLFSGTGQGIYLFSIASQSGFWVHNAYHLMGNRGSFPWVKAAVAWSLPLASIQCPRLRTSSYKSTLPVWHHDVQEDIYWTWNVAKPHIGSTQYFLYSRVAQV